MPRKPASRTASEQAELLAEAENGADEYIDLSNVKAEHGGAVPKGHYLCEIETVAAGVTGERAKVPGLKKITVTWKVLENPDGEIPSGKIFKHLTLQGDQAGRSRGWVEDLGFDLGQRFNPKEMVGLIAWLDVSIQKDNPAFNNIDAIEVVEEPSGDDAN